VDLHLHHFIRLLALLSLFLVSLLLPASIGEPAQAVSPIPPVQGLDDQARSANNGLYLPLVISLQKAGGISSIPQVNVPYFSGEIKREESAIFWFGQVKGAENYSDVRIGYNAEELFIQLGVFDRFVWYDEHPAPQDLENWDAATIYLDTAGNTGSSPGKSTYRFTGQLNWWEERTGYQAAYRGSEMGWLPLAAPFSTETGWRGDTPNNMDADRGWRIAFRIPFTSLGLSGPPPEGTVWGVAVRLFDRDDAAGTPILPKTWPGGANLGRSSTWGKMSFGLPEFSAPDISPGGTTTIRQGLNGTQVFDGQVGGSTNCGSGLEVFTKWGEANYGGYDKINIQNQGDLADWPCFSKFYVTFPLDRVPAGRVIISAKLTLYQFGNAGGGEWGPGPNSLIQVITVAKDWDEYTLNWNNAPLPVENVSRSWVGWLGSQPAWPGVARTWDVSRAVQSAYTTGGPLRLVLYSADLERHSGKYFITSDIPDWNEDGRPTLEVVWGNP
jgi:hypothetical protein